MRRRLTGYGLAFFGGVLLHFGFRGDEPMPEQEPGIAPRPVGQQESRAGFTATRDLFRASRGLKEAARLLERIESAGPAALPRLYALFAMEGGLWLEILEEEWAERDPRGLLAYRLGIAHVDDLNGTVLRVFDALSVSDPQEVFGLLATVPVRATRDELQWRLLSNLAVADRAGATELLAANGASFARAQLPEERGDGLAILRFGELVETINGVPDSAIRAELLRNLFRERRWDAEAPGLVLAWCGIADPEVAATLFQPEYDFLEKADADVIAAVSRRIDEVLKTQVTGELLDWLRQVDERDGRVDSMRKVFDLALEARTRNALGPIWGLEQVQNVLGNLSGERLAFAMENIDRLPLGEAYRFAATQIAGEFATRGEYTAGLAWMGSLSGGVRDQALGNFAAELSGQLGAAGAIGFLQAGLPPDDAAAAVEGVGKQLASLDRLEEVLPLADLLDPVSRTRFLEGFGSHWWKNSGPMLDAVSLWPEADRAAVFRSFSKIDYLYFGSDDPPLTPAQREQILAIAAAYISDPEKRAQFLQYVE